MTSMFATQLVSIAIKVYSFQDTASHTYAPGHSSATWGVLSPQEHCLTEHANIHQHSMILAA